MTKAAKTVSLSLLVLRTGQMEKVLAFYRALGIDFCQEQHGRGPLHHAAQVGELVLELYPLAGEEEADRTTRLGFNVADLGRVIASLRANGVTCNEPKQTEWGERVVVHDPDGRAVELYQRSDR